MNWRQLPRWLVDLACRFGALLWARVRRARQAELGMGWQMDSIVVFNPVAGLGNMVLLTGLLVNLRRLYPRARIAVAMPSSPLASAVLGGNLADELLYYDAAQYSRRTLLRFAWTQLRPRHFDLALGTFFAPRLLTACMFALARCRYRIAYAQAPHRGFLNTITLVDQGGHELDRHLRLLSYSSELRERRTVVSVTRQAAATAIEFLEEHHIGVERPLLGIHPGCDRGNALKRWPAEWFTAVMMQILREGSADILVFLGPEDMELYERFAGMIGRHVRIICASNLERVMAFMARCQGFLSNDSGLMHVAAALDVPVLAIFGPTDTVKNEPVGSAIVLTADVACRPCHTQSPITCPYPRRHCLEGIGVAQVVVNLRHIIAQRALSADVTMSSAGYVA